MEAVGGFLGNAILALTQPVNCAANFGSAVLHSGAEFVTCVAGNWVSLLGGS